MTRIETKEERKRTRTTKQNTSHSSYLVQESLFNSFAEDVLKNRYRTHRFVIHEISVFLVKFPVEFTS